MSKIDERVHGRPPRYQHRRRRRIRSPRRRTWGDPCNGRADQSSRPGRGRDRRGVLHRRGVVVAARDRDARLDGHDDDHGRRAGARHQQRPAAAGSRRCRGAPGVGGGCTLTRLRRAGAPRCRRGVDLLGTQHRPRDGGEHRHPLRDPPPRPGPDRPVDVQWPGGHGAVQHLWRRRRRRRRLEPDRIDARGDRRCVDRRDGAVVVAGPPGGVRSRAVPRDRHPRQRRGVGHPQAGGRPREEEGRGTISCRKPPTSISAATPRAASTSPPSHRRSTTTPA